MNQNLPVTPMRWVRAEDGVIGGVCTNIARQMNVDVWIVRVIWLAAILFAGTGIFAYILCVMALPRTDHLAQATDKKILGVCARLAKRGNAEVGLVRLMALILLVSSAGLVFVAYIALHFVLPESDLNSPSQTRSIV